MSLSKLLSIKLIAFIAIISFPFDQVFTSAFPNFGISPFRIITIFISLYVIKYNSSIRGPFKNVFLLFIAYCSLSLLSTLWSNNTVLSFNYAAQLIIMLGFTIVALSKLADDHKTIIQLLFYVSVVGGIIALLSLLGFFSDKILESEHRMSFTRIGVNAVAISISYSFIFSIMYLIFINRINIRTIIIFSLSFIMLIFLIRTGTRSGIIGVFISVGLGYLLSYKFNLRHLLKFSFIFFLIIFSFNYIIDNIVSERIATRILSINLESINENSRIAIWNLATEWYSNNVLGTGAGNEAQVFNKFNVKEAHNVYISSMLQLGMIGLLILVLAMAKIFLKLINIRNPNYKFLAMTTFLFLLIQTMKGSFIQTRLFWIPIILVMTIAVIDIKKYRANSQNENNSLCRNTQK